MPAAMPHGELTAPRMTDAPTHGELRQIRVPEEKLYQRVRWRLA